MEQVQVFVLYTTTTTTSYAHCNCTVLGFFLGGATTLLGRQLAIVKKL
jgi:hypothetical protein